MKRAIGGGAILLFLGVALYFWWQIQEAQPNLSSQQLSNQPQSSSPQAFIRPLQVAFLRGEISLHNTQRGIFEMINEGDDIGASVRLRSFENTFVVLKRAESAERLELGENTQVFVERWEIDKQIYFDRGELFLSAGGEKGVYRIDTADFELVTSNADYRLYTHETTTRVEVTGGTLLVTRRRDGAQTKLDKGEWMSLPKRSALVKNEHPFQMITPMPNDHVHMPTGEIKIPTRFAWRGIPDSFVTDIYAGSSEADLSKTVFEDIRKEGEGILSFGEGVHYWKMVFREPQKKGKRGKVIETPVYRLLVLRESPVQIKSPRAKVSPSHIKAFGGVKFSWSNPSRLERLILEVASDQNFDRIVRRQPVEDVGEQILQLDGVGSFYWRINGFRRGSSEFISSQTHQFEISNADQPPTILSPLEAEVFTVLALKDRRVPLIWRTDIVGPVTVQIYAKDKPIIEAILSSEEPWTLPELQPGRYELSLGTGNGRDLLKSTVGFEVVNADPLKWDLPASEQSENVLVQTPILKWQTGPRRTSMYRLRLWPIFSRNRDIEPKSILIDETSWQYDGPKDNLALITVQALDQDGEIIGETPEILYQSP